jgi:multidrug resistance efflux pump
VNERSDNDHPVSGNLGLTQDSRPTPVSLSDRVRSLRLDKPTQAAPRSTWLPWTLCLLLAGSTAGLGYVAFGPAGSETKNLAGDSSSGTSATSGLSTFSNNQIAPGEVVLDRKGYVIPAHLILVSPKVSGMIERLSIEEGQRVKKDEVLAELETIDYKADYDRAVGSVRVAWQRFLELYTGNRGQEIKQAKAELEEAEANKQQLYLDWKRNTRLTGTSAMAIRDYEQADYAYRAMERRVEKLRQAYELMLEGARAERIHAAWGDVEQAEADLTKAKWRLDNCMIRAPVSGTILTKKAEIGNLVNPIAFNGSFSLCEMADLSDLEVDMSIEEREVSKVFKGQLCKVRPEAFPEREYRGVVSRLMPSADRPKSAIPVRVKLIVPREEEGVYLKPDMGVIVLFLKKSEKETPTK